MKDFDSYNFKQTTLDFLKLNNFNHFYPIQEKMIPLFLRKKDIIGISSTGSGKTHAFLVPLMEMIDTNNHTIQAVICSPTRELAQQLFNNSKLMMKANKDLRIKLISGGTNKERVNESLKTQPHIVIGTPGRIKDLFLNDESLLIQTANIMIIDEGDMTLEYGFLNDIDQIAGKMKENLQMIVLSATIPNSLNQFLKKYMHNPETVIVDNKTEYNPNIEHVLINCKHKKYEEKLLDLLPIINPYMCLIFANTRESADDAYTLLKNNGYRVLILHGGMEARERKQALNAIINHDFTYIVATDIAARGLDNDYITHVVSLGFPKDLNFYIHRSGRTGRAHKEGTCFALYRDEDKNSINSLINKGIVFKHKTIKNNELMELKPYGYVRKKPVSELDIEIQKIIKKPTKVKPGYKKKRAQLIDKLKRKKKREFIKNEINKQKKERAKAKIRESYDKK